MPNTRGYNPSHLKALRDKHASLERKIETEQQCPSMSSIILKKLKAEKLRIKDEIEEERRHATGRA